MRFSGGTKVGIGYDFDQRHTASIEVQISVPARIRKTFVQRLARILFHMDPLHAYFLSRSIDGDLDETVLRQRPVVLRNLIALGQVRIEVVFTSPLRLGVDLATETQRRAHRYRYSDAIQNRQRTRQAKTYRTRIHIGSFSKL